MKKAITIIMYLISLCWILQSCLPAGVFAEEGIARAWTSFRHEDGLAHNIVTSIAQTPDGALWFGTFDGISRYDGRNWQTFGRGEGLPGDLVWDLEAQPNGVVWAAIGGGFVGGGGGRPGPAGLGLGS